MSIYLEFPPLSEYPVYSLQSNLVVNNNDANVRELRSQEIAGDFVDSLDDMQFINALGFFKQTTK